MIADGLFDDGVWDSGHSLEVLRLAVDVLESDGLVAVAEDVGQHVGALGDAGQVADLGDGTLLSLGTGCIEIEMSSYLVGRPTIEASPGF